MAISTSPRKVVPLSTGDEHETRPRLIPLSTTPAVTKRAFFCGVVVEGPNDGEDLSDDIQDLVASLGDRMTTDFSESESPNTSTSPTESVRSKADSKPNARALSDLIEELVSTEETYVTRLRILKKSYADPLRSYARSKDTAIIPAYVANTLFGNIDQIVPANEAFFRDLQQLMTPDGPHTVGGVGDVALRHFKDLRAFDCYKNYYAKREEAQMLFKQEMSKRSSGGFAAFVESTKYSTNDAKNRVGLRELMMEPVQRIPRYTLLFRSMMKLMDHRDPQRIKLVEADELASRIALAETDDHTKLAATLNCLAASIEGFPPDLIKSSRKFIDCIDVEDNITDGFGMGSGSNPYSSVSSSAASVNSNSSGGGTLHCTLFLFDDKLMIVKRPNSDKAGRVLAGLDDVDRLAHGAFSFRSFMKKSVMSCKGVIDVTDVVATDVSGPDMHFYFETPPCDQTDRWSGRPLRFFSVVHPPYSVNQDPMRSESDKKRFLENLWRVQARFRTKIGQSVALRGDDVEVDNRGGKITTARTYFNVYQRTSFLKEPRKTKIVLHIDSLGIADPLPFGLNEAPYVIVRVHPMEGDLSRYSVTSSDPDDAAEEEIIPTIRIPKKIVHTIHQYGLFRFRTYTTSRPATPASLRSRAHLFGLDVISRNLFGALPGSRGDRDVFGNDGSIGSHRRSKSAISRSSTRTDTTTTGTADSMRFSSRSASTVATSMSSFADEDSFGERSVTKSRKLVKRNRSRSRSPGTALGADSGDERSSSSPRRSRSNSVPNMNYDLDDYDAPDLRSKREVNQSELDLTRRLELARRNSRNQHGLEPPSGVLEAPVEETIYEEEPPLPMRPLSRASRSTASTAHDRDGASLRSNTPPTTRSITPTPRSPSPFKSRSESLHTIDRRPLGPRPPSPLPPLSPSMPSMPTPPMDIDIEKALDATIARLDPMPRTPEYGERDEPLDPPTPSPLPRSKRQPFNPTGNIESTPKSSNAIVPLSIKKKTSNASATRPNMSPSLSRRQHVRNSPLSRGGSKQLRDSPSRKLSPALECSASSEARQRLLRLAETTKDDLESSNRAVKRIRLELSSCPTRTAQTVSEDNSKSATRTNPTTPTRAAAANFEARARMEEMQKLIGQRQSAIPRRTKTLEPSMSASSVEGTSVDNRAWLKTIDDLATSAEGDLSRASRNFEAIEKDLKQFATSSDNSSELDKCRAELRGSKRQCELLKDLLNDSTAENEIMYQAFNEELDGMFNDANLPADEAWSAMTSDLRKAKEDRNRLTRENAQLKRKMQEIESQRDEWASLLREHGLIP